MPIGSEIWPRRASGLKPGRWNTMRVVLTGLWGRGHRTNSPERSRLAEISLAYKLGLPPQNVSLSKLL